jgi:phosphate-selective porin OprO and OprP
MLNSKTGSWRLFLFVVGATLLLHTSAHAQSASETKTGPTSAPANSGEERQTAANFASRGDETPNQVELLRREVEQLRTLVERQQLAIAKMEKQVLELKAQAASAPAPTFPAGDPAKTESAERAPTAGPATAAAKTAESQTPNQKTPLVVAGWDGNHAFLRSADGKFETFFAGYMQLDFHGYSSGNHPANTFLFRRARLSLEGKIAHYFDYKLEGDFADTSSTLLRDAFIRIHRIDQFQLTFGQVREPFSQEELRLDSAQDFAERSLVNNLAPSRSPGFMASGVLRKGVFEYQLGAFNGKGLLAANTSGTPETVARVRITPWKNTDSFWLKGFSVGGAAAYGRGTGGTSVRGQTESRSISFFVPDTVNGRIWRANTELTWMLGPAAIRAEYDQTNQERHGLGTGGRTLPGVVAKGYMGQFTYLLTGETKPENGSVVPRHNLFGEEKGQPNFGAWELKFRYSNLAISDGTAKSNRAETFYFGPNWYLNKFVRYVLDFGVERFKDPLRTPRAGDKNLFVVLSRVQLLF